MKVLVLYSGTRSVEKAFEEAGHETYSIEWDRKHDNIDWYTDVNNVTAEDVLERFGQPDIIWASPDCTTYSVAAISHHRTKNAETGSLDPKSDKAKVSDNTVEHVLNLIQELNPKAFFIENPRGGMRKMGFISELKRHTVTYCQYGDKRMKPTDIFTNISGTIFKQMCRNGDPCHEAAPRGSRTGTQGLKGDVARGIIPHELCQHVVKISERIVERGY